MKADTRPSTRQKPPAPVRTNTVFMGRSDFASTQLRLVGVELYKLRRRTMSKVLASLSLGAILITFSIFGLYTLSITQSAVAAYLPPRCQPGQVQSCLNHAPTAQDLAQAQQSKQQNVYAASTSLRLPQSFGLTATVAYNVGLLLIIVLAGTIVGGEYHFGTIRLMLIRGPTRSQFLFMKVGAILISIIVGLLATMLFGIILGIAFNLGTGIAQPLALLTASWILHAILYTLIMMLGLFTYAMLALVLAVLGRATVAGVVGALGYALLEPAIAERLKLVVSLSGGIVKDILQAIPDCFIGDNVAALLQNQDRYLSGGQPASISNLQALLVLIIYLAIFIGLAWRVIRQRDVTN